MDVVVVVVALLRARFDGAADGVTRGSVVDIEGPLKRLTGWVLGGTGIVAFDGEGAPVAGAALADCIAIATPKPRAAETLARSTLRRAPRAAWEARRDALPSVPTRGPMDDATTSGRGASGAGLLGRTSSLMGAIVDRAGCHRARNA